MRGKNGRRSYLFRGDSVWRRHAQRKRTGVAAPEGRTLPDVGTGKG
jgi:hypothetical protein